VFVKELASMIVLPIPAPSMVNSFPLRSTVSGYVPASTTMV